MAKRSKDGTGQQKSPVPRAGGLITTIKTSLIWPLLSNLWTYVVAGIIAIGSTLVLAGWGAANSQLKNYLAGVVSEKIEDEFNNEKGPLYLAINNAITKIRKFDVGEISAGTFVLDPINSSNVLAVYVPTDKIYSVKLYYHMEIAFPSCQRVELTPPSGKPEQLELGDHVYDFGDALLKRASVPAEESAGNDHIDTDPNSPRQQLSKNFRGITFQLKGQATPEVNDFCSHVSQRIRINYVTLVVPTIRMGR